MVFTPSSFQQMAGLVCYYNAHKFHYLYMSFDEGIGLHLGVMSCNGDQTLGVSYPADNTRIVIKNDTAFLRATVARNTLAFAWSANGEQWHTIGDFLDYSVLSDEAGKGEGANFTGAFVGMCCQDLIGGSAPADFHYFEYSGA